MTVVVTPARRRPRRPFAFAVVWRPSPRAQTHQLLGVGRSPAEAVRNAHAWTDPDTHPLRLSRRLESRARYLVVAIPHTVHARALRADAPEITLRPTWRRHWHRGRVFEIFVPASD